jgi:excisionase family DNA binding protein
MSIPPPPKAGMRGRPISKLRTIDETAEILCVSARTVRRLVSSGELTAPKFRRLVRIYFLYVFPNVTPRPFGTPWGARGQQRTT